MPKWPVTSSCEANACTPDVDSTRYLRATLSCTDLATDLVRGECASSPCSRPPSPLAHDWHASLGPESLTLWHGPFARGPRPWQTSGKLRCYSRVLRRGAHASYIHWPARLGPCFTAALGPLLRCQLALQLALQQPIPPPLSSSADSSARQQLPARPAAAILARALILPQRRYASF